MSHKRIVALSIVVCLACMAAFAPLAMADVTPPAETVTLRWIFQAPEQEKDEPVLAEINRLLLERHNLQLDATFVAMPDYDTYMNLVVSSGEYYDLCNTSTGRNKYEPNIARNALLALDDLIDEYHPDFYELLPQALFDNARVGGKLYAIPNYQAIYREWGFIAQKSLTEKYGWDLSGVKTMRELGPYLEEVREKEPQLYTINTYNAEATLAGKYYELSNGAYVSYEDPYTVVYPEAELKELAATHHDWFVRGLLRADIATTQTIQTDMAAGKYAFMFHLLKVGFDVEADQRYGADYDVYSLTQPWLQSTAGRSTMSGINSMTKYPKESLDMIYIMNTDLDVYNLMNFGIEGVNYTLDEEGKVVQVPDSGYFLNYAWSYGNNLNAYLQAGQADDTWTLTDEINRSATPSPVPGFSVNITELGNLITQLSAINSEYTGIEWREDFEALWDEKEAAIAPYREKFMAECQSQLDAWRVANGL